MGSRTLKKTDGLDRRESRGFSLIELMVAITLGFIVLIAVSATFMTSKQSYNIQDRLARLQENGRFALQFILHDLRHAGYFGCQQDLSPNTNYFEHDATFPVGVALEGLPDATASRRWAPSGDAAGMPDILKGTDALTIRMLDGAQTTDLKNSMTNADGALQVADATLFDPGDRVLISDCAGSDLFVVTGKTGGLQHAPLQKPYRNIAATRVGIPVSRRYYIHAGDKDEPPALWRKDNNDDGTELVEGIEDMQILYGRDTDGNGTPDEYLAAGHDRLNEAAEWRQVRSVRVAMLARTISEEDNEPDTSTYVVNDVTRTMTGADRHKRRVFTATAMLRNARS